MILNNRSIPFLTESLITLDLTVCPYILSINYSLVLHNRKENSEQPFRWFATLFRAIRGNKGSEIPVQRGK